MKSPGRSRSKSNQKATSHSPVRRSRRKRRSIDDAAPLHPLLHLQQTIGNQAVSQLVQAKLQVGQPGDKFEQQANRVANRVMHMPEPGVQRQPEEKKEEMRRQPAEEKKEEMRRQPTEEKKEEMQRQPVEKEKEEARRQPAEKEKEEMRRQPNEEEKKDAVQAKENAGGVPALTPGLQANINAVRGGGKPLPGPVRAFFEPRFGTDFSEVRVHSGTRAAATAEAVNAKAFTVGKDVVFGANQYAPEKAEGKKLLAHELTHVVQQTGSSGTPGTINREADKKPSETSSTKRGESKGKPDLKSLSDKELRDRVRNVFLQDRTSRGLSSLTKELSSRIKHKAATKSNKQIENFLKKYAEIQKKFPNDSADFFILQVYLSIYQMEDSIRPKPFPPEKLQEREKKFKERAFKGGLACLDVAFINVESLCSREEIEAVEGARETRHILDLKNIIEMFEKRRAFKGKGVPEKQIIEEAAALKIDKERTKQILLKMQRTGMIFWRKDTNRWSRDPGKEFAKGLLTKSATALQEIGITGSEKKINYLLDAETNAQKNQVSLWLAEQIKAWIERVVPKTPGSYFFILSLHMDYHSVTLEVIRKTNGMIHINWIDQFGSENVSTNTALKNNIRNRFWPGGYVPKYSTLWPLRPQGGSK